MESSVQDKDTQWVLEGEEKTEVPRKHSGYGWGKKESKMSCWGPRQ